jgi:hypothetical protein
MLKSIVSLAAGASLALASAAVPANTDHITSDQFQPGWQAHARPLINHGHGPGASATTVWWVPGNLPRGRYYLVNRQGDGAILIDGYAFDVTSDPERQLRIVLPQYYGAVDAVPAAVVPQYQDTSSRAHFEGP